MQNNGLSLADVAALQNGNVNQGSWIWFLLIFVLLGWGGGRGAAPVQGNGVTQSELTNGLNNQALQNQIQQIALATQQNNYETAQLINGQTNAMMQQNNTNLINAIQGFNQVNASVSTQTSQLGAQIAELSHHMDECCCSMKQLVQDNRMADLQQKLDEANLKLSNAQQTQNILGVSGRWVGWSGTGTQTAGVVTA